MNALATAALLALAAPALADDEDLAPAIEDTRVEGEQPAARPHAGSGEPNPIGATRGRGAVAGARAGASGGYPAGVPRNTKWIPFERLKDIPEAAGANRILRVPGPAIGWAVGFMTHSGFPAGERRSGMFATAPSPRAPTPDSCNKYMWISAKVGGPPVAGCFSGPIGGASPNSVNWLVLGARQPRPKSACVLEAGKRFYAHYTATGWDRADEHRPAHCDTLISAALSYVPD